MRKGLVMLQLRNLNNLPLDNTLLSVVLYHNSRDERGPPTTLVGRSQSSPDT